MDVQEGTQCHYSFSGNHILNLFTYLVHNRHEHPCSKYGFSSPQKLGEMLRALVPSYDFLAPVMQGATQMFPKNILRLYTYNKT